MVKNNYSVIVTDTWYNDSEDVRARLAVDTFRKAKDKNYYVITVDGGSPKELLEEFRDLGVQVYPQEQRGMGNGRRQGFKLAIETGLPVIARMEAEKRSLIDSLDQVALLVLDKKYNLVLPRRESLETYPEVQQYCENAGNLITNNLMGVNLDWWFGPRVGTPEIFQKYFLNPPEENFGDKWESIFFPVVNAISNGEKVGSKTIEYIHPEEQTLAEQTDPKRDIKRAEQLFALTTGISNYQEFLKK